MATVTTIPTKNEGNTFGGVSSAANAYTNTSSTNYATYTLRTGTAGNQEEVYLSGFNFSSIPANATINSITIKVKTQINSTTYVASSSSQAYAGTVAKGSPSSLQNTSATVYTLTPGDWTRAELDTLRVHFTIKRSGASGNRSRAAYIRIYGAEVTIDWSREAQMYVKQNNSWTLVSKVYKKENNAWVLQQDLSNLFDTNQNYVDATNMS